MEHELPQATNKWGWKFHHHGIPVNHPIPGERHIPHLKMYVAGFPESPYGIEWMRFEADCPLPELVKTVPHLAFVVDNIEEALQGKNVITPPNPPSEGVVVAMIEDNGAPIEVMQFL